MSPLRRASLGLAALLGCALACVNSVPDDLSRGARVMSYMAAPANMRQSLFMGIYPQGKPSEFVSFLFSPMGKAEWPPSASEAAGDPMLDEQVRAVRMPILPRGVEFTDRSPKSDLGRQIVLRFNDEKNELIIEAYESPTEPPVLRQVRPFRLPALSAQQREVIQQMARSNLDMGIPSQSF